MAAAAAAVVTWVSSNWAVAVSIAAAAASAYKMSQIEKPNTKTQRDYKTTLRQSVSPIVRVYGKSMGGGIMSFVEEEQSNSANNQKVTLAVVSAGHEINKLTKVMFGEQVAYSTDGAMDHKLIETYDKGKGTFSGDGLRRTGDHQFIISDNYTWHKVFRDNRLGKGIVVFMKNSKNEWKQLTVTGTKAEKYISHSSSDREIVTIAGVYVNVAEFVPTDITAVKIGTAPYSLHDVNNPKSINDVPDVLKKTKQWTNDMVGKGLHYIGFELNYDRAVYPEGLPLFKMEREGAKLYDPRKDKTVGGSGSHRFGDESTYEYSNNAALVILDLLTYVYEYKLEEIDVQSFIEAANHCGGDEQRLGKGKGFSSKAGLVSVNGSLEPRYTINGEMSYDESFLDVISGMLKACSGNIILNAGKLGLRVGVYNGIADSTIRESDIIGNVSIQSETSYSDRINSVQVKYTEPAERYTEADTELITSSQLLKEDGGVELSTSLDVSRWVTSKNQATRLGWIYLRKIRDTKTIKVNTNLSKAAAVAGRKVDFDLPTFHVNGEFICTEWEFSGEGGVALTLTKDDPTYYEENFTYHPPSKGITDREEIEIPRPKGITFLPPTDTETQGYITWMGDSSYSYNVDIFRDNKLVQSELVDEPIYQINGLKAGKSYLAVIRMVNDFGQTGQGAGFDIVPKSVAQAVYTWIAYADNDKGSGISLSPKGKTYIGFAENMTTPTADLSDPKRFRWALFKGSNGRNGTNGKDGTNGKNGLIPIAVYKVSGSTPTTPKGATIPPTGWSTTPPNTSVGDVVYVSFTYALAANASKGNGIWTVAGVFSVHPRDGVAGVKGNDGKDGSTIYREFWFSPNGNGTPSTHKANWGATQRAGDKYLISREVRDGKFGSWSPATKIAGADGRNGTNGKNGLDGKKGDAGRNGTDGKYFETRYKASSTQPKLSAGDKANKSPSGWVTSPMDVTFPVRVWAITATKHANGNLDTQWSDAVRWNGDRGATGAAGKTGSAGKNGRDGKNGEPGTVWVYKEDWNGISPKESELNSFFKALAARNAKKGDVIILRQKKGSKVVKTKAYLKGSTWAEYKHYIDGNMLVDGSITGKNVSSKTTITAGSGIHTAGMNGDDTGGHPDDRGFRFWAGAEHAKNAPFRVLNDGTVIATKGHFYGNVNATSINGDSVERIVFEQDGTIKIPTHNKGQPQQWGNMMRIKIDPAPYDRKIFLNNLIFHGKGTGNAKIYVKFVLAETENYTKAERGIAMTGSFSTWVLSPISSFENSRLTSVYKALKYEGGLLKSLTIPKDKIVWFKVYATCYGNAEGTFSNGEYGWFSLIKKDKIRYSNAENKGAGFVPYEEEI